MSFGGEGIISVVPPVTDRDRAYATPFLFRRFRVGGNLHIKDSEQIKKVGFPTCVLCGGLIGKNEDANYEHPLPQWLYRFAGDVGDRKALDFKASEFLEPTWRQCCLVSHSSCNTIFARSIENPAISAIKGMAEGRIISCGELDRAFDWLDKVKSASAHMGTALRGHNLILNYHEASFPNRRIGYSDRLAIIFRLRDLKNGLDLMNCINDGFLTTPSAIILRIKDLLIVYASNAFMLSSAFGLGRIEIVNGQKDYVIGDGRFCSGFGDRITRLPGCKIIAQPMRRQLKKIGPIDENHALQDNGDGKVYELIKGRWTKVKSTDFSELATLEDRVGLALASIETIEWIMLAKYHDNRLYTGAENFSLKSLPYLAAQKDLLISRLKHFRRGIGVDWNDRNSSN